jgi:L-ascorbate metabolism protein UlaG (beta-lactamase superfamily)
MPTHRSSPSLTLTYVGGPTALLEYRGLRLLTDPTFDPAPTAYDLPGYTLRKTQGPALARAALGRLDAVLLSHDHHVDNLDRAGREVATSAARVVTTAEGAERLGANAVGLAPGEAFVLTAPDGSDVRVTATPGRHGPAGGDRGPVAGFVVEAEGEPTVWFSGDTVLYGGVLRVTERFDVDVALLCLGAARVSVAGDSPLTLTAADAARLAGAMPWARVVPLHFEGWEHFTESRADVDAAFAAAGVADRLHWAPPGAPTVVRGIQRAPV